MRTTNKFKSLLAITGLLLTSSAATAQSWNIGSPTATDVVATLDDTTLTITGTGTGVMADYEYSAAPWYPSKDAIKTVVINGGVTSIGDQAFRDCSGLTSVTIPNSVASIGRNAFVGCGGLIGALTIPDGVTSIGEGAFQFCSGLTSVTIPDSVTSIENATFAGCSSLTSVTIPNSVTSIGQAAFMNCSGLTSVTCLATTPPTMQSSNFQGNDTDTLYVPIASLEAYKALHRGYRVAFSEIVGIATSTTAISTTNKDEIALYGISNGIAIATKAATSVSIFNIAGQKVYQSIVDGSAEIGLTQGVYVVRVGDESKKVIVK
ncbi:hypothetical protein AGMMS49982_13560 [Bacteroidia bacterium]|nr:hypothetical protein AGMMS49982_13560 [Bacteroidia bacterium]